MLLYRHNLHPLFKMLIHCDPEMQKTFSSLDILHFNCAHIQTYSNALLHDSMPSLYTYKESPEICYYFRDGGLGPAVSQQKAISGSPPQVSDASQHKFNWFETYLINSLTINSPQLRVINIFYLSTGIIIFNCLKLRLSVIIIIIIIIIIIPFDKS